MFRLIIAIAILSAAMWSGFWIYGSGKFEDKIAGYLAALQQTGWKTSHGDIETRGFPNRFDSTISDLRLVNPPGWFGWHLPFVQVLALSYRSDRFILAFPTRQVMNIGDHGFWINPDGMRASVDFLEANPKVVKQAIFESEGIQISGTSGWKAGFGKTLLAARQVQGDTRNYRIAVQARHHPGLAAGAETSLAAVLVKDWTGIDVDANMVFNKPVSVHSCSEPAIRLEEIDLSRFALRMKKTEINVSGNLRIDNRNRMSGRIAVHYHGSVDPLKEALERQELSMPERLLVGAWLASKGQDFSFEVSIEEGLGTLLEQIKFPVPVPTPCADNLLPGS